MRKGLLQSPSDRAGQSTIEFVLTLIMLLGFVLFYTRIGFLLGYANLVQYATFMAARAYQAGGIDQAAQEEAASNTIVDLLKRSRGLRGEERFKIARPVGGGSPSGARIGPGDNFVATDEGFSWEQGVRYSFEGQLLVNLFGSKATSESAADGASPGKLRLTSESWLGREVTEEECLTELRSRQGPRGQRVEGPDNGC